MHNIQEELVITKTNTLYNALLYLYPYQYRNRFSTEMMLIFQDMYIAELEQKGSIGLFFYLMIINDTLISLAQLHMNELHKKGFEKYLQNIWGINRYHILSAVFLIPFFSVFFIDLISRIAQWDVTKPNQAVVHYLYQTPLYWFPILLTWVLIFPLMSILLAFISFAKQVIKKRNHICSFFFLQKNFASVLLLLIGTSCIGILALHDLAPCVINKIVGQGVFYIIPAIQSCTKG